MKSKHTPGPWTIRHEPQEFKVVIEANTKTWICTAPMPPKETSLRGEDEANAHLIAAAPELLAALASLCKAVSDSGRWLPDEFADAFRAGEKAITKAKGQP